MGQQGNLNWLINIDGMYSSCGKIDVHEYMRRRITNDTTPEYRTPQGRGASDPAQPQIHEQALQPGFDDVTIYFDSRYRDGTSDYSIGEVKWSITLINNSRQIDNYVQITLGSFYFPKVYGDPGGPEFYYYNRVYMEITSAPTTQAIFGSNNMKFHFEFEVENLNGSAVRLVPIFPTYYFQRPVSSMSDLTLRFLVPPLAGPITPLKRIPIPADTVPVVMILNGGAGYNPIRFQIGGGYNTSVLAPVGAVTAPGLAVTISDFLSADAGVNDQVLAQNGIYVTTILSASTFEVAGINSAAIVSQVPATLYIPKNRFAIPIRFTSVRTSPTNYITTVRV